MLEDMTDVCSSSSMTETEGGSPKALGEQLLQANNYYRRKHGVPLLEGNKEAATRAQQWADHLADLGKLEHGNHSGMGQNLFCKSAYGSAVTVTGAEVAESWYKEIKEYDYSQPGFSRKAGHFTQMVWASTRSMGSGSAVKNNTVYVVANYFPPGNFVGRQNFIDNVKRPNAK